MLPSEATAMLGSPSPELPRSISGSATGGCRVRRGALRSSATGRAGGVGSWGSGPGSSDDVGTAGSPVEGSADGSGAGESVETGAAADVALPWGGALAVGETPEQPATSSARTHSGAQVRTSTPFADAPAHLSVTH